MRPVVMGKRGSGCAFKQRDCANTPPASVIIQTTFRGGNMASFLSQPAYLTSQP